MKMSRFFSVAVATILTLAGANARADYVFTIGWGGLWAVNPGYMTEDPPNGEVGGTVSLQTPTAAGTYSFHNPSAWCDCTDLQVLVTVTPDANPTDGATLSYSGSFSSVLDGQYPSTWGFSGSTDPDTFGSLIASIDAPYGGVGSGSSGVGDVTYAVPEPSSILTTAAGLAIVGLGLRRRKARLH